MVSRCGCYGRDGLPHHDSHPRKGSTMMSTSPHRAPSRLLPTVFVVIAALVTPAVTQAQRTSAPAAAMSVATPLAAVPPQSVGMSGARLTRLTIDFQKEIADQKLPGAVMLVARKGKLVHASALGVRDPRGADPMRTDTIFRIYSMTKPMVSVATMILVEEGRLQLTDPVSRWMPAFKDMAG